MYNWSIDECDLMDVELLYLFLVVLVSSLGMNCYLYYNTIISYKFFSRLSPMPMCACAGMSCILTNTDRYNLGLQILFSSVIDKDRFIDYFFWLVNYILRVLFIKLLICRCLLCNV